MTDYWLQQIWEYLTPGLLIGRRLGPRFLGRRWLRRSCHPRQLAVHTSAGLFSRQVGRRLKICALTGRGVKDCNITREQRTEKRARQRRLIFAEANSPSSFSGSMTGRERPGFLEMAPPPPHFDENIEMIPPHIWMGFSRATLTRAAFLCSLFSRNVTILHAPPRERADRS